MENKREKRSVEITAQYFSFLDHHINDVISGQSPAFMELNQIAARLAVSHKHLTDTIQKETGNHPCHFYDARIIDKAKELLVQPALSVTQVAHTLTYDPANFTKFFKKWTGETPGSFKKNNQKKEED